ncbi:hypothetical protein GCM10010272_66360 [Streptomyces lateritius]|nr:hypothetical protein GCM10010272_66360 [Streptomyces lateritius]
MPDKVLARLVLGGTHQQHADHQVSATTLRSRRDERIAAGVFEAPHQAALDAYDQIIGLGLKNLAADECIVKTPSGGENTGLRPWIGETEIKRSLLVEGGGLPIGFARQRQPARLAAVTPHLGGPWALRLPSARPDHGALGLGGDSHVTHKLLTYLGYGWQIPKGTFLPINHSHRCVVERRTPGTHGAASSHWQSSLTGVRWCRARG